MSTQIKRLYQNGTEFVPITLSEAVVVNTRNITGFSQEITTLDKVLQTTLGFVGTNSVNIETLQTAVDTINENISQLSQNKQDKLTPGVGIEITDQGQINCTLTLDVFKVVDELPANPVENTIYIVPSDNTTSYNIFAEYIYVNNSWEKLGEIQAQVDLTSYYTKSEIDDKLIELNSEITEKIDALTESMQNISAEDVMYNGNPIVVTYNIPDDLYKDAVTNNNDLIV